MAQCPCGKCALLCTVKNSSHCFSWTNQGEGNFLSSCEPAPASPGAGTSMEHLPTRASGGGRSSAAVSSDSCLPTPSGRRSLFSSYLYVRDLLLLLLPKTRVSPVGCHLICFIGRWHPGVNVTRKKKTQKNKERIKGGTCRAIWPIVSQFYA